jgi:hypothetical protein
MPTVMVWQCPTKSTLRSRTNSPGARRSEKLGVTKIAAEQLAQPDPRKHGARRLARTFGAFKETRRGKPFLNMPGFDPARYKAALRDEWSVSADGWKRHWDMWARDAQSVNDRLVELVGICPGHRVLDIATGLGEPAFTAARRVGPSGLVWRPTCLQLCLPWLVKKPYGWDYATSSSGKWTPRSLTCRRMLSTLLSVGGP